MPRKTAIAFFLVGIIGSAPPALALTTAATGGGLQVSEVQPSLGVRQIIRLQGEFANIGEIVPFAGNFAPRGWAFCEGQIITIAQNTSLFARLGTFYGGDGQLTFALPDLRGRTPIHRGQGSGLSNRTIGGQVGAESITLSLDQMPAHEHGLPFGGATSTTGGPPLPIDNMQPSLAMNYVAPLSANWPYPISGQAQAPFFGQMRLYGGTNVPAGHVSADGQLLQIAQDTALFAILGTNYGGNGQTNFALPDLRGRAPIHEGAGPGLTPRTIAESLGSESSTLSVNQLPAHTHALPPSPDDANPTGGGQPHANMQPSLTLSYIIAVDGALPSLGVDVGDVTFLGKMALWAGSANPPAGWAYCDGQLLTVAENTPLFNILETTFGGDGVATFALPDLRGRTVIGVGQGSGLSQRLSGEQIGVENVSLSVGQLPSHTHDYIPEPAALLQAAGACAALAAQRQFRRRAA